MNHAPPKVKFSFVWENHAPPKVKFFAWLLIQNRIQCSVNLKRKNILDSDTCEVCKRLPESADHLISGCTFSQSFWRHIGWDPAAIPPVSATGAANSRWCSYPLVAHYVPAMLLATMESLTQCCVPKQTPQPATPAAGVPCCSKALVMAPPGIATR